MKKFIMLLLCLALILSVSGCTQETQTKQQENGLQVGYGRAVITPEAPMPLRGYGNPLYRISTEVLDDLYATCVAFTDADGNTVLLFHLDLCTSYNGPTMLARQAVSEATGVPYDNVMVSATHMHSGPELTVEHTSVEPYITLLQERMVEAAVAAMADRKEAQMYVASTELVGMNFVRHYVMDDGSVIGDNFGSAEGKSYVRHVSDADNVMQLVQFKRQGGQDVVLCNWQTHPHRAGSATSTQITSDIVGAMRSFVEAQMDCGFAYFSGASGNVNPNSRISGENVTANYLEQGQAMGRSAVMALDGAQLLASGKVQILGQTEDIYVSGSNVGIPVEMHAFSVGDLAFITAPYEMFDTNGMYIKENSPFEMTFVVTYANAGNGYIAAQNAYVYGGYEVEYRNYEMGTAETLAEGYVQMLGQLYDTRNAQSAVPAEQPEATLYWNLDRGTERSADADGSYSVNLLADGQKVTFRVTEEALLARIDTQQVMGLVLDGDVITDIRTLDDLPYQRVGWDYYVQSMGGKTLKLNATKQYNGAEVMTELTDTTQVYDLSELAEYPGAPTQLQKNDGVTAIADEEGKLVSVFVTDRAAVLEAQKRYCQQCELDVQWYSWHSDSALPTGDGHYYLTTDVSLTGTTVLGDVSLCLDLNGKTVKQTVDGERIYMLQGATQMSVMDSVGSGVLIPSSTGDSLEYRYKWGMIFEMNHDDCVLNIRSGTLDASECTAQYGCAINCVTGTINLYDGTIRGGTAYGTGSTAIRAGGVFNMYGGTVIGGTNPDVGFESINIHGGATVRIAGTATIYGGTIVGGRSDFNGGSLYVSGTLKMTGGSVSGGECKSVGGGVYLTEGGKLVLGGEAQITGNVGTNLYVAKGGTVEIHEDGLAGAKIGISSEVDGVFASGTFTAETAACFVSDVKGVRVTVTDQGLALE